jgi:hypothetical protein
VPGSSRPFEWPGAVEAVIATKPSAKYSCSGSPLTLINGSTAIDGLSGCARERD